MTLVRFILGAAFGSFLKVVADRYDPDRFLLTRAIVGGRSQCPSCRARLRWFELVPVVSYLMQGGKCRHCGGRVSVSYPLVEILTGLLFVAVPLAVDAHYFFGAPPFPLTALWVLVFLLLLLIALIDLRLTLIPDEATAFLALCGIGIAFFAGPETSAAGGSFLGPYSLLFGRPEGIAVNRALAAFSALAFFAALILATRGRGMGMGDLKLAGALGLVFGWPDILLILALGFVLGSLVGFWVILRGRGTRKSFLPFGPFLAGGALITFFFGSDIVRIYLQFFGL